MYIYKLKYFNLETYIPIMKYKEFNRALINEST